MRRRHGIGLWISAGILLFPIAARAGCTEASAVSLGEVDDFEATTEEWANSAGAVSRVVDGGDEGAGDDYLQVVANGSGSGGKLVAGNGCQWTGSYDAVGSAVTIGMMARNQGATDIILRLAVGDSLPSPSPPGSWYVTSNAAAVSLPAGGGWTPIAFTLEAPDMVCASETSPCGSTLATVLGGVLRTRLLHSTTAALGPHASPITGILGIDDIHIVLPIFSDGFETGDTSAWE